MSIKDRKCFHVLIMPSLFSPLFYYIYIVTFFLYINLDISLYKSLITLFHNLYRISQSDKYSVRNGVISENLQGTRMATSYFV